VPVARGPRHGGQGHITRTTAVLAFHKIGRPPADGGWDTWNYIDEATFTDQLRVLGTERHQVIDLRTFINGLRDPAALPERTALLTFDDGYRSMLEIAQPILGRFGFPSVCFVPTGHIAGSNTWDQGNEPSEPICDWHELRELQRRGVVIQSHGVSHRGFADLDPGALDYELRKSKERLEDALDAGVETLAYPYGDAGRSPDQTAELLRDAGYAAAFLYKGGRLTLPSATPFQITRVPMGPDTDLRGWLRGERR
jgi:peptidoglycan/xylan/chitin deacetylase (PgdA/CDA1 family)